MDAKLAAKMFKANAAKMARKVVARMKLDAEIEELRIEQDAFLDGTSTVTAVKPKRKYSRKAVDPSTPKKKPGPKPKKKLEEKPSEE